MDLANVKKGEGSLSLEIVDGKIVSSLKYDGKQADAELKISLDVEEYLEMLKDAIPGEVDDAVISLLQAAMKQ